MEHFLWCWLSLEWHEMENFQAASQLKIHLHYVIHSTSTLQLHIPQTLKYFRLGFRAWVISNHRWKFHFHVLLSSFCSIFNPNQCALQYWNLGERWVIFNITLC